MARNLVTMWWFDTNIYCENIHPMKWINTSITSYIHLFFFMVRMFNFYLSKFQLCNTVSSTIVTMFHFRSSDLLDVIAESLYPFTSLSLFLPSPAPANRFSTVYMRSTSFIFKLPPLSDTLQCLSAFAWPLSNGDISTLSRGHCCQQCLEQAAVEGGAWSHLPEDGTRGGHFFHLQKQVLVSLWLCMTFSATFLIVGPR